MAGCVPEKSIEAVAERQILRATGELAVLRAGSRAVAADLGVPLAEITGGVSGADASSANALASSGVTLALAGRPMRGEEKPGAWRPSLLQGGRAGVARQRAPLWFVWGQKLNVRINLLMWGFFFFA